MKDFFMAHPFWAFCMSWLFIVAVYETLKLLFIQLRHWTRGE